MEKKVSVKKGDKTIDIYLSQLTVENLRRVFKINSAELYLEEYGGGMVFCPEDGRFKLGEEFNEFCLLTVVSSEPEPTRTQTMSSTPRPSTSATRPPVFRSVVASKGQQSHRVKVIRVSKKRVSKGKYEFTENSQTWVNVTSETANVNYVNKAIKELWGDEYRLVTVDGIEIDDSPTTRDLEFWKTSPRRKLYAMKVSGKGKDKKRSVIELSSDDEDFMPAQKRTKSQVASIIKDTSEQLQDVQASIADIISAIDACTSTQEDVLAHIKSIVSVTSGTRIPISLQILLKETFKCTICTTVPINPPVIATKCCKSILGCQSCVNQWYSGEEACTKTCPRCRAERGLAETMHFNGLDDFLTELKQIIAD